jgi:hypothetical protein
MRMGRAVFRTRCQTRIPRTTVACVRGAENLMAVKACGPNAGPPPVAREASEGGHDHAGHDHAGHDHAGHDHGAPPAGDAKASEADCRAFVKKLDALMTARLPPDARAAAAAKPPADLEAQQAAIVRQCVEQAPASVIRCALAAADLAGIDACHEKAGLMSEEARPKPGGTPASEADCRAFVGHFVALNAAGASPEEAAKMRARMEANLPAMTAHCVEEVPAEVVRCGLAAKTVDALGRCDIASPAPPSGLAAPAPAPPQGRVPQAPTTLPAPAQKR